MKKIEIKDLIGTSNPIIFEIGCADGIDTHEFLKEFGNELNIHCFEPDPRNAKVFKEGGFRANQTDLTGPILGNNLVFNEFALGEIDGKINMYQTNTIYSSSLKKPTENLFNTWKYINIQDEIEVKCMKLDTYVYEKNIGCIDFIWADVQGAEDYLIKGGNETFSKKVKYFYTEYAKNENNSYYEESPDLGKILYLLGNNWTLVNDYGTDALFKNNSL